MKFFGMGGFELVIILVIVLIIFGPKNLPKLGKGIGKGLNGPATKGVESGQGEDRREVRRSRGRKPSELKRSCRCRESRKGAKRPIS